MKNTIVNSTVVDLTFWSNVSSRTDPHPPAVSRKREAQIPEGLAALKCSPDSPMTKRARMGEPRRMIDAPESDDVNVSHVKLSDRKPAAKIDMKAFEKELRNRGYNLDARRKLRELAEQCPDLFRDGVDAIPPGVNSRAVSDVNSMLSRHPDNPNVLGVIQACFAVMIKRTTNPSVALTKRDTLIQEMITEESANPSVLAMLKDQRFHDVIFPDRTYVQDDLNKLMLMRDFVSGHSKVQYELLASHAHLLASRDLTSERLQYAMAVVAKRIDQSEPYDFIELLENESYSLACELLKTTAPEGYDRSINLATAVADKKAKAAVGAKLLAFLAEHPDLIDSLETIINSTENPPAGRGIAKLVNMGKTHMDVYAECLRNTHNAVAVTVAGNPVILSHFSSQQCTHMASLIAQQEGSEIFDFYSTSKPHDLVNLTCEVIRRRHQLGACVAETSAARQYVSVVANVNKALYSTLMREGTLSSRWDAVNNGVIKLHQDFGMSMSVHSDSDCNQLIQKAHILNATLPTGQYSTADVLGLVTTQYDFIKGLSLDTVQQFLSANEHVRAMITESDEINQGHGTAWVQFANRHLIDLTRLSHDTLRELSMVTRYCRSQIPGVGQATLLFLEQLGQSQRWQRFMNQDDTVKQRFLQHVINNLEQRVVAGMARVLGPQPARRLNQITIHSQEVTAMAASTAAALVKAYEISGWDAHKSVDGKGQPVIEPIPSEKLDVALRQFTAHVESTLGEYAARILRYEPSDGDPPVEGSLPSVSEANKIHEKVYARVVLLARDVTELKKELNEHRVKERPSVATLRNIEGKLAEKESMLKKLTQLTLPYGALQYLSSKHLESEPKHVIGTNLPKLSLKQVFGMALLMPKLDAERLDQHGHGKWYEGLDTNAERQEGVYERLTEALHDSHIAYLGLKRYDASDSCWDGGVNRFMDEVRTLMDFEIMPSIGKISGEFPQFVTATLKSVSTPTFLNDTALASRELRQHISNQLNIDIQKRDRDGDDGPLCVSPGLYKLITPRVYAQIKDEYPQMFSNQVNYDKTELMVKAVVDSVRYIEVPLFVINAYAGAAAARAESGDQAPAAIPEHDAA